MYIPTNRILVNKQGISEEHVDDFVEWIERGRTIRPITVRVATLADKVYHEYDHHIESGKYYVLVDGRHRLAAYKVLGKEMIECLVTL